ncbi:MAG: hypothetical protein ACRD5H_06890 [Nitrososphaerales archaeon]
MTTLSQVETRIFDELKATLSVAVRNAYISSVGHYHTHRFWFNEGHATFTTSASLAGYTLAAMSREFANIEDVSLMQSNLPYRILRIPWSNYTDRGGRRIFGTPNYYTIYGGILYLSPAPNATYTVEVSGVLNLTLSTCASASNVWTNEAADLMIARTKADFTLNFMKRPDEAEVYYTYERVVLRRLLDETNARSGFFADIQPYF